MMLRVTDMASKLESVFSKRQARVLTEVITNAYNKVSDFNELKAIVKELAEAQKRTENRVEGLAERVEELAEAQKRTENRVEGLAERMEELAEAQKRTETRLEELAEAQKRTETRLEELAEAQKNTQLHLQELTGQMVGMKREIGGLGRTMAYALENEAYRMVPPLLEEKYGIRVSERFVRTFISGQEINLFGRGRRNGKEVVIVGEAKLRLDERRSGGEGVSAVFDQLADKVSVVKDKYPDVEVVPVLITHHARPSVMEEARKRGVIVIQSFEW